MTATWLITGANSGLGLALAKYVLAQGAKVIATARDVSRLPQELSAATPLALNLDWSDEKIKSTILDAWKTHGPFDVVANNAGYSLTGPVEVLSANDIEAQFKTNLFSQISVIQALIPVMRERKSGTFFNFSSVAGMAGNPPFSAYNASKAALEAFTEALAKEVAPFGLRAYIVEPGFFPTSFLATAHSTTNHEATDRLYPQFTGITQRYHDIRVKDGQVGDVDKLAKVVFDVGSQPSLLKEGWVRLPVGPDSGKRILAKLESIQENVEGTRALWESTDLSLEEVKKRWGSA
ncbi:NAD(P)-binding protein [Auriculariales sp. MPI-PUGE-AT-0066]|nr:NAD(P)-binding protein [Auriculariales sp. MPI-PUGE-AT-0066]